MYFSPWISSCLFGLILMKVKIKLFQVYFLRVGKSSPFSFCRFSFLSVSHDMTIIVKKTNSNLLMLAQQAAGSFFLYKLFWCVSQ
ncbi:hypothetical protein RJT34_03626 [Clitoria ternatea]|uniref:Uncharacterized protein n=1 Tax=Clitoria ternatea TaxID=43366 RepID=A0AAN9Q594_CLITE